jgi:hypothetical protein
VNGDGVIPLPSQWDSHSTDGYTGARARFLLQSVATGYFLYDAANSTSQLAKCLDGTPSLYYHRPGFDDGGGKWFVFMQGGGWCQSQPDPNSTQNNYDTCAQRASERPPLRTSYLGPSLQADSSRALLIPSLRRLAFTPSEPRTQPAGGVAARLAHVCRRAPRAPKP